MAALTVLLNKGEGDEQAQLAAEIRKAFANVGMQVGIVAIQPDDDFTDIAECAVFRAKKIVVAGGDGSVNLVAGLCHKHGVTLGVIPLGTFNYFARELLIPMEIEGAVAVIAEGFERMVSVGKVNEYVFLNNASFGLYTRLIRQREEATSRFGRARIIAAFAAAYSLLHAQKLFSIMLDEKPVQTSMVFVGNNSLQLENLGLHGADCTKADRLAVIVMKEVSRIEIARFILRGMAGILNNEEKLREFCADDFEVSTRRAGIDMVIDGEIVRCATPLAFSVAKNGLRVFAPQEQA